MPKHPGTTPTRTSCTSAFFVGKSRVRACTAEAPHPQNEDRSPHQQKESRSHNEARATLSAATILHENTTEASERARALVTLLPACKWLWDRIPTRSSCIGSNKINKVRSAGTKIRSVRNQVARKQQQIRSVRNPAGRMLNLKWILIVDGT